MDPSLMHIAGMILSKRTTRGSTLESLNPASKIRKVLLGRIILRPAPVGGFALLRLPLHGFDRARRYRLHCIHRHLTLWDLRLHRIEHVDGIQPHLLEAVLELTPQVLDDFSNRIFALYAAYRIASLM